MEQTSRTCIAARRSYVDRILKGQSPPTCRLAADEVRSGDQPDQTAKALGLDVPPMLLARADEVIE